MRLKIPDRIETERLVLVPPHIKDAPAINEAIRASYRELHRWMPWATHCPTLAETKTFCRKAARVFAAHKEFPLTIKLKPEGHVLGSCGLVRGDWSVPKFEIGYWIHSDLVGHGYATEAVQALTGFARKTLQVRRLEIRVNTGNPRSAAVAERAGFVLESVMRQGSRDNRGRLCDTQIFTKVF